MEVKIPEVGESVKEALLTQWYRRDGDTVHKGELLFLIETDKVTLEVVAEGDGILKILVPEGATVPVGTVVATIEGEGAREGLEAKEAAGGASREEGRAAEQEAQPVLGAAAALVPREGRDHAGAAVLPSESPPGQIIAAPSTVLFAEEEGVDLAKVRATGPGGRVTRGDVRLFLEQSFSPEGEEPAAGAAVRPSVPAAERGFPAAEAGGSTPSAEPTTREPMSPIRRRIAEHLLAAGQSAAMLTTFNEVDMSRVQTLRVQFRDAYQAKYGVSLGIMPFFVKAAVAALKEYPAVNAFIEGHEIIYHHYYHIGVAIGAERGLVVPVIRHADRFGFAGLERAIRDYLTKVQENRLELSDLEGGTFTVSNGGIFGSLLSTPILNSPQSGILGLHKIEDRPIALNGEVVIRPMMYVALTYDHRLVDGRVAVSFLKRIKEYVENPERMMLEI